MGTWCGWLASSVIATTTLLAGCDRITNNPHPGGSEKTNTFFTAFTERSPKYLDPTASYSLDETPYTYAIFEPLYRFHYLKRPYQVAPRAAEAIATPRYYDDVMRLIAELDAELPQVVIQVLIAEVLSLIHISEPTRH